jgi:HAD superfamily hydrolase (TIGR01490 family)
MSLSSRRRFSEWKTPQPAATLEEAVRIPFAMPGAAFFDLDRTLIRRSSALALAGAFRERGLISSTTLARAALWQILFVARGANAEAVRRVAEDGMAVLRGFPVEEMRQLVAEAMEPVLKPLVYAEPFALVQRHRERGEPVYIVSATLQEILDGLAVELGFDGALGSTGEVVDGVFTGKVLRALHHEGKAACIRELAEREGIDLAASTAYSDSHSDLPFLKAVGHAVAVNPDRALRRCAAEHGWPVLEFRERLYPLPRRRVPLALAGIPLLLGAAWAAKRRAR